MIFVHFIARHENSLKIQACQAGTGGFSHEGSEIEINISKTATVAEVR